MIKRKFGIAALTICACALVVVPAGAKPGGDNRGQAMKAAVQACKQERNEGREAFAEKYGAHPMKSCVQQMIGEARNAAQECRAERDEDADAFREKYGTNHNGRNAFGKCVSGKVSGETADDGGDTGTGEDGGTGDVPPA